MAQQIIGNKKAPPSPSHTALPQAGRGDVRSINMSVSSELFDTIPFVWEKVAAFINKKQERAGLIAAYTFELNNNLDLLGAIKIDALRGTSISDPVFRGLISHLHTEVAVSILFSPNRKNYHNFVSMLKKHLKPEDIFDADAETETDAAEQGQSAINSILKAITFSIRKIEVLKSLAACAETEAESERASALFPDYRLTVRVRNIKKSLGLLKKCVDRIEKKDT
jgi:hypothetical protein